MKRRILVTGSSGFLAGHLVARLRDCPWTGEVRGADKAPGLSSPRDAALDIADAGSLQRLLSAFPPDIVFHLSSPPPSAPLEELRRVNVAGTRALLASLSLLDPQPRVLVAGSAAEYGLGRAGGGAVGEEIPPRPRSPYGISKAEQTFACLEEARRTGLPVIVFRPFNIIGPGMPEHLAFGSFARQIARAERDPVAGVMRVGRLDGVRDFVDARDVAAALLLLAESGRPGEIYNVCTGDLRSVREGLEILLGLSAAAVRPVEEMSSGAYAEPPGFAGDPSKLRHDTGWQASVPFKDSLRDLLESARKATEDARQ